MRKIQQQRGLVRDGEGIVYAIQIGAWTPFDEWLDVKAYFQVVVICELGFAMNWGIGEKQ